MKRLNKLIINEEKRLTNNELVILRGGDIFCCYCTSGYSLVGDAYIRVGYENVQEALQDVYQDCSPYGYGVTCSGETCPGQ